MKLLVLHGPNMNLFGIRSSKVGKKITLDKINRSIRRFIRGKNVEIKVGNSLELKDNKRKAKLELVE